MYDVVVIGAGCVGAMTIRELTKYNLKACILEKENDFSLGATRANSAIVHAGFDAEPGTLKAKLNVRGAELFRTVTKELGVKFINNGSLVIGFDEKDKEHLELLTTIPETVPMNPKDMAEAVSVTIDKAPSPEQFIVTENKIGEIATDSSTEISSKTEGFVVEDIDTTESQVDFDAEF